MNKRDRLIHGQTVMTHAMLFTGVDVVDGSLKVESRELMGDKGKRGQGILHDE